MSAVGKRYAKALFEVAKEQDQLSVIEKELHQIDEVLADHPQFFKFLEHPQIEKEQKKEVFSAVFQGQVSKTMLQFMHLLIDRDREEALSEVQEYYVKLANKERGIEDAVVTTTKPLSDEEKQNLTAHFNHIVGREIRVHNVLDASIVGGIVVKIGDRLYDGSVTGKLNRFKRRLVTSKS
ncbi:F0F1 ATP synthase subunit delta [Caldalkalibacillus salinus]|uniref:F0F1 ATP synthase subunit delta n=1 Tax=Caldalkalibacillus salinus TaxID=2803787 RepID=UPI001921D509|nr:F0F1 ATP synthase subunit delta [Caldalkalibacillus salinus]